MGQIRWKIFIYHTSSATLQSTYQNSFMLVEIRQSSDRNKNAQFFRHSVDALWEVQQTDTVSTLMHYSYNSYKYVATVG